MSQSVVPVHPQIKKIIQNLDLDLGLELNRYENSHLQESLLIADPIVEESILYHEKESNPQVQIKVLNNFFNFRMHRHY